MSRNDTVARLQMLREEITTALGAVLDNNPGLAVQLEKCTYDHAGGFTFKLTGTLPGGKSKEVSAYEFLAQYRGERGSMPPIGSKLTFNKQTVRVDGARSGRARYNIIVEFVDGPRAGTRTCLMADDVARLWAKEQAK